jgi:arginine deiminase
VLTNEADVRLQVDSEVGRLRRVLVHEPGVEVDLMVPAMMEQLLFDDILYGERARDEHGRFRRVLQLFGIEVHDASDLLAAALELPEARRWLLDALLDDLPGEYLRHLEGLSVAQLASRLVTGERRPPGSPESRTGEPYGIPPLPNWCFQRDTQIVLGRGVIFCSMAAPARHREALLSRVLFRFHPELSGVPVWFEPLRSDPQRPLFVGQERPNLEGGDVLVLSPEVVVVGLSERTNRTAINTLARALGSTPCSPSWTGTPASFTPLSCFPAVQKRPGSSKSISVPRIARRSPVMICSEAWLSTALIWNRSPAAERIRWISNASSGPTAPTRWRSHLA